MGIPAREARRRRPRSPVRPGLHVARHRVGFTPGGPQGPSPAVLGQLPGVGAESGDGLARSGDHGSPPTVSAAGTCVCWFLPGPSSVCGGRVRRRGVCVSWGGRLPQKEVGIQRSGGFARSEPFSPLFFPPWRAGASFSLTLSTLVRLWRGREARTHRCLSGVSSPTRSPLHVWLLLLSGRSRRPSIRSRWC